LTNQFNHNMSKVGFVPVLGGYSDFFGYLSWISLRIISNMILGCRISPILIFSTLISENYVEYKDADIFAQISYAWPNIMVRLLISLGLGVISK
jgi:hypothetical protein